MILITSEKAFLKRRKKWVVYRDFLILDAVDDAASKVYDCGNRLWANELAPTPILAKIAADPDSEDAKIKRRQINRYIEKWLEDEIIEMKIGFITDVLCHNIISTGEDMNIFVVMANKHYKMYANALAEKINDTFHHPLAVLIDHNMPKDTQKQLLQQEPNENDIRELSKMVKKFMSRFSANQLKDLYSALYA